MTARASTSRKLVHYFLEKLSGILAQAYGVGAKNLGDQGGYAQLLDTPKQAITIIEKAIQAAGYELGTEIRLDAAASEFYNAETRQGVEVGVFKSGEEMIGYWKDMIERHPIIISLDDELHEQDYDNWIKLNGAW